MWLGDPPRSPFWVNHRNFPMLIWPLFSTLLIIPLPSALLSTPHFPRSHLSISTPSSLPLLLTYPHYYNHYTLVRSKSDNMPAPKQATATQATQNTTHTEPDASTEAQVQAETGKKNAALNGDLAADDANSAGEDDDEDTPASAVSQASCLTLTCGHIAFLPFLPSRHQGRTPFAADLIQH